MKNIVLIVIFVLSLLPITSMAGLYVAPSSLEQLSDGSACNGCKLYFYEPGTTTLKTVYTDSGLTTAHTNPVTAASSGRFDPIYMDGTYKVVLKDADGNTIDTNDNFSTGSSSDFFGSTDLITATTAIDASYEKHHLRVTGTVNLNLQAVATAGEGFTFSMRNDGTGLVTIDPSGAEQINDALTWIVPPAGGGQIIASSAEWSFVDTVGIPQSLATGDMFYYSADSGSLVRLPIGGAEDILFASTQGPEWNSMRDKDAVTLVSNDLIIAADTSNSDVIFSVSAMELASLALPKSIQTLTAASGTYTPTANASKGIVIACGGGGGGGGADSASSSSEVGAGGGGGGGAAVAVFEITGTTAYTVGAGGSGGDTSGSSGTAGGTTTFTGFAVATGGSGGNGTGSAATDVISLGSAGGIGTTGTLLLEGGDGGNGSNNSVGSSSGGNGGDAPLCGGGGRGGIVSPGETTPAAGNNYGGGGGGAATATTAGVAGAAGANGVIYVFEF